MIFAREISDPLTSLVKKIDSATTGNSKCSMGSFVVFLNDDEGFTKKLKELAKKEGLKDCVLTVLDNKAGPPGYNIAKDADVTVVLYTDRTVKSNYAFRRGELTPQAIERIVADIPQILPGNGKEKK
jgi:hypothetical protein